MAPKKDKRSASLNRYLSSQSDVANARASLMADLKSYNQAKFYFENLSPSSKDFSAALDNWNTAKARAESLQKAVNDAEAAATLRFEQQETEKTKAKKAQETSDIEKLLNPLYVQRNAYIKQGAPVPESITKVITELETDLRKKGGRPTPGVTGPVGPDQTVDGTGATGVTGGTGVTTPMESALAEDRVAFAQKYIGNVEKTKELQQALKDAGVYKGPVDGIFRAGPIDEALDKADTEIGKYESYGITFPDRIEALKRIATDFKSGGGPGGVVPTTTISSRATATTYINAALKQVGIDRVATPQEIDSLFKVLNDAESRFKTTIKNGVTRNLLGDRTQFIANLITTGKYVDPNTGKSIKGVKEDVKKASKVLSTLSKSAQTLKADTRSLTVQTLQSTANANGVSLSPQQLEQYALEVQNGKDIKVIQSQIRNVAGAGMPDRVVETIG
jgi:hypothetical protein